MAPKKKQQPGLADAEIIRKYESGAKDVAALIKQLLEPPGDEDAGADSRKREEPGENVPGKDSD